MNIFRVPKFAATVLGLFSLAASAAAQTQGFQFSVRPSVAALQVGDSFTYTIGVTNLSGFTLSDLWVTNSFSAPVTIGTVNFTVGNGFNYVGSVFPGSNTVVLDFQQFSPALLSSGSAEADVTVVAQATGPLTNTVTVIAPSLQTTGNEAFTNVVVPVTNTTVQADLAVSLFGFGQGILAGDMVTYGVSVTNRGPASVEGVLLTNTLPPGTLLVSVNPTNRSSRLINGRLVVDLGTLTNAALALVHLTVQPTNAGPRTFSASVGAANLNDGNLANNSSSTTVQVGAAVAGRIVATNASPMSLDPQTGLMEQTVRLLNIGTSSVPSVRLTISGLTNWLFNAAGTNNGNPFVLYAGTLNTNQSVNLALEYFVPTRLPVTVADSNYTAVGIPAVDLTPPAGSNGIFSITRSVLLPNGGVLIEFPSLRGATYSILYSSDLSFSNALSAQPAITAPGDRVEWIDDGPPKTVSPPPSAASRFYRVLRN